MFGLFGKKSAKCPIEEDHRLYFDEAFLWLAGTFGLEAVKERKVLALNDPLFRIPFDGSMDSAYRVLDIIGGIMGLDSENILIDVYSEAPPEIKTGSAFENRAFLNLAPGEQGTAGHYLGKGSDGRFHIAIEEKQLRKPENLIATLAHEMAHLILLGGNLIEENDEYLTDLTTIVFGLGIFGANSAFVFSQTTDSYGWRSSGYLSQMQWGYALALYAYMRGEKSPHWIRDLTLNVREDFKQSERFIYLNEDKILKAAPR